MNEDYIYAKISEEESNNGEEATNITEIISLLDELRENCTQGDWKWEYGDDGLDVVTAEEGHKLATFFEKEAERINDTAYIVALHNNYESLRQAVLDGERYRKEAEQYQRFKVLLGMKSHDSIMRLTSENKDFPVTATMIMMEEDNERRRNAMRYIEASARAGKDLAKAIEKSQEGNDWCADCLAKVDCKEALETYRQAVKQKEV
jgi:hypothetical protein